MILNMVSGGRRLTLNATAKREITLVGLSFIHYCDISFRSYSDYILDLHCTFIQKVLGIF